MSIQQKNDSGFVISGCSWSFGGVAGDAYLINIDSSGVIPVLELEGTKINFTISPNPATLHFSIGTSEMRGNCKRLEVINLLGEIIYSEIYLYDTITLKCDRFLKGIYFIKLQSEKGSAVQKLIID